MSRSSRTVPTPFVFKFLRASRRVRKHQCRFCSRAFVNSRDCVGHENAVHLRQKPFRCDVCPKGFYNEGQLNQHKKHKHEPF